MCCPGCAKEQRPNTCVSTFTSSTPVGHSGTPTQVTGTTKPPRRSTGCGSSMLIRVLRSKSRTYRHLTALHGILVNDKYLLLGFFGWDTTGRAPELTGAERPHRLYRREDIASSQLFEMFEEWFRNAPQKVILELPAAVSVTSTAASTVSK